MLHTPTRERRIKNTAVLVAASVLAIVIFEIAQTSLGTVAHWTGWTVFASCAVLLFYAVRKRLSTMPLGRVAHWLQVHLYLGIFCLLVFGLHIDWRLPNGWFETCLAISFVGTIVTGLLGIYWSRTIPTELTRLGDEVIYERIPAFVTGIYNNAQSEVLAAVEQSGSKGLADFYQAGVHGYLAKPRFQWARLYRNVSPEQKLLQRLETSKRFMSADEIEYADRLGELIVQKSRLDAHYTWQGLLKHWLFVHFAFSLSLIPLVLLHVMLAYSFALG